MIMIILYTLTQMMILLMFLMMCIDLLKKLFFSDISKKTYVNISKKVIFGTLTVYQMNFMTFQI